MNPDIDLRLAPLTKALTEVVLPALPESERLARDQVMLVIGHLGMIANQWKRALGFELESFDALCALAEELAPLLDDEPLAGAMRDALETAAALDRTNYDTVQNASRALARLIDRAISDDYRTIPLDSTIRDAVLDYSELQTRRERIWFAGNGLDPDQQPPLESLFDGSG